ncbi:MAG: translation initiation factor IF-2 [Candidatus Woykebacteria bacterium]
MKKTNISQQLIEKKIEAPAVVAVLGHVDHGKTTLLDNIRKTRVADKEVGGITQHVSSYQVEHKGKKITFIDTPGHEAFSQMRARGAKVTDLVILVVAADDGVMPQTKESIAHIKNAGVPFLVAINKVDLPSTNLEKVKKQLSQEGVLVEGYGGDVVAVPISAKTGQGVSELLDMVQLVSEMSEVKKEVGGDFEGVVIESSLDRFKGPIATIIVKKGILRVGDFVFSETCTGKVRSITTFDGVSIKEAGASVPVQILGLEVVPSVGDTLTVREVKKGEADKVEKSPWDWSSAPKSTEVRLVVKADTYGSLEAITNSIEALKGPGQEIKFIHKETGDINESDVLLAAASKSIVVGFSVKVAPAVEKIASEEKVNIRVFSLIYELLDEIKEALSSLAEAKRDKEVLGEAEILAKFESEGALIAGCRVTSGRINKADTVAIFRAGKKINETEIKSMKHKLLDINEAESGKEFGVIFDKKANFEKGDIIRSLKN